MAIQKKESKRVYEVKVTSAREIKSGRYGFNADVNGISISGFMFIEYTNKEGKAGTMISMPQQKGKEDKYYNTVWFPISKELKEDIEKQISDLINS